MNDGNRILYTYDMKMKSTEIIFLQKSTQLLLFIYSNNLCFSVAFVDTYYRLDKLNSIILLPSIIIINIIEYAIVNA